jgi:hypothetical protein
MSAAEGIALAGVILSALLGYLGYRTGKEARIDARELERDRWAREDRHRNRDERVAAYAAFLAAMESKIESLIGDMNLAEVGQTRDDESEYDDPGVPLQTIFVLAPGPVASAADELHGYSVKFGLDVVSKQVGTMGVKTQPAPWKPFDAEEYHRLRGVLLDAIHADLDITAGPAAQ